MVQILKILMTGVAGFIGSNIAKRLHKEHELYGFDDLSTGSMDNLKGVDIEMIGSMNELQDSGAEIDIIFHLGMPSSTPIYRNDRYQVLNAIKVTLDVLELAKHLKERGKECKVVYASSSSVYNGNEPPFKEDMKIIVTDFMTEARLHIERLAQLYSDFYGITAVGLRLFSVYGPNERRKGNFANLVTQFLDWMHKGEQPIIYGDGKQTRDFSYVKDVVDAFIQASKHGKTDVFNIGTGKCYNLNELVTLLNKILGKDIKPKYVVNPLKNYVNLTLADTTKAENVLGFKTKFSLEEGIKDYMAEEPPS